MTAAHGNEAGAPPSPRVSVLITTYNAAGFIAETIASVLGQTFGDFELVIVDDGSTDSTREILARYDDPRMRILSTPCNLGVVGARNYGYRALRGAYVATLDHDDVWRPTRLQAGVAVLDSQPATVFVATGTAVLFHGQLTGVDRPAVATPMLLRWMLLMDCPFVYSSLLFRRASAALPEHGFMRPDARYADDYELMLRLAFAGDGVLIDAPLTLYRVHGRNTTEFVRGEMQENAAKILAEVYARWLNGDAVAAAERIACHVARRQAAASLQELDAVGNDIARLLAGFLATCQPSGRDRQSIVDNARAAFWRVVRASVRSGRIWLIFCYLRRPSLSIVTVAPGDVALSLASGLVTLLFRPGRMRCNTTGGGRVEVK